MNCKEAGLFYPFVFFPIRVEPNVTWWSITSDVDIQERVYVISTPQSAQTYCVMRSVMDGSLRMVASQSYGPETRPKCH